MKEIDLLKLKKTQEKLNYLYFLKDPSNFSHTITILAAISTSILLNNLPNYIFGGTITLINFITLTKKYTHLKNNGYISSYSILKKHIENTEEYKKCKEQYNKYIENIASFLRIFNFSSSKEVIIFMEYALTNGLFSKTHHHQYHLYKNYYEYAIDLLGATTITGASVCRHMTSFFVDVLLKYGLPSEFTIVQTSDKKTIPQVTTEFSAINKYDHSVVTIRDNNTKYLFDPTHGIFAASPKEQISNDLITSIAETVPYKTISPSPLYYAIANQTTQLQKNSPIATLPLATISSNEIEYYYNQAAQKFINSHNLLHEFYIENIPLTTSISSLISQINPNSDTDITSWKLTKSLTSPK